MRMGCLVQRLMATTLMTNDQLGLKERRDASSAGPPGYPCGMHAVFGGLNTAPYTMVSYCQMSRCHKVLSRVVGAIAPVADRAHHLPGPDVYHPHMQDVLRSSALLKPDIEEPPFVSKPPGTS